MPARRTKLEFESGGVKLAGLLESPSAGASHFALFAHCFTCGKDIAAASRIARALVARGIAVLRFDFTGLGNSDGDFANSNFSSNVDDLVAAADFLRSEYEAPQLLIGHSLGGAAVLNAAHRIPECKALVTIGAPADASHVSQQFASDVDKIQSEGVAEVLLAGRPFTIKKQFLEDIAQSDSEHIGSLKRALLVMHSPVDTTVSISQAEKIYTAAKHPKSFISLDDADHLLSQKHDSEYVASTIAAWASKYIPEHEVIAQAQAGVKSGEVVITEKNKRFTRGVLSDSHYWLADEPTKVGGDNLGPDPYEHLLAALGTCTSMTVRMYANRKKWPLDDIKVTLHHERKHGEDCAECDEKHTQVDVLARTIQFSGDLDDTQRTRLIEIADKCPVHKTLGNKIVITTEERR